MPRCLIRSLVVLDKFLCCNSQFACNTSIFSGNCDVYASLYNSFVGRARRLKFDVTDHTGVSTYQVKKMRDQAYRICRDYLSGSWKSISSSDMVFRSISGGMSNLLYYCSLPETHTPLVGEPHQVLMRMYGQIHGAEAKVTESVIFMMLSERKLGPKLYGIFPGGRLEEYIPARAMTCDELKDPEISATIARKLAKVHTLNVPINKEPTWLFDKMQDWINFAKNEVQLGNLNDETKEIAMSLLSQDFQKEFLWLKSLLTKVASPVLFCHNDLQEGNILLPERTAGSEDKIVFIDFEYSSYNFRGFDIANHFCEWCFDYAFPEYPHFLCKPEEYPSIDQQLNFIRSYLRNFESSSSETDVSDEVNSEEHVLQEVLIFNLASHFLWTLWSIVNAQNSQIQFGYWEYGKARWDAYLRHKTELFKQEKIDLLM